MRSFDNNGIRLAELQGKIFEESVNRFNCSSSIFIRRFLLSDIVKIIDKNEISSIYFTDKEALDIIENYFGESDYGKEKFSAEAMFWIGYFYRYISYTRDIRSRLLFKLIPYKKLNEVYYTYHTQSMEWCFENICELCNLTEDDFDKNKRLKKYYYKTYLS